MDGDDVLQIYLPGDNTLGIHGMIGRFADDGDARIFFPDLLKYDYYSWCWIDKADLASMSRGKLGNQRDELK